MDPIEENVEYHIEIQNCEVGEDAGHGDVMFVLDLGGADIPENIAMQLAQLAADGSLNLSEGTNSIMVQNEVGGNETHIMQVEKEGIIGEGTRQIIHLQMEEDTEFLPQAAAASVVSPVAEIDFTDVCVPVEKSIFGKSKSKSVNSLNLLDRNQKIDRTSKSGPNKPKTLVFQESGDHVSQNYKNSKVSNVLDVRGKKSKGDVLPIYPFLKGKTPVMLTLAEDGQVVSEDNASCETITKSETRASTTDDKKSPIVLDFSTEKSKLDLILASMEGQQNVIGQSLTNNAAKAKPKSSSKEGSDLETDFLLPLKKKDIVDADAVSGVKSESLIQGNDESILTAHTRDSLHDKGLTQVESEAIDFTKTQLSSADLPKRLCEYEDCQFEDSSPLIMALHLQEVHEDITPYHCFICEKKFKLKLTLLVHELIHKKDARPARKKRGPYGARNKFYQCPLCNEKHKLKQEIYLHAKNEHQFDKANIFTCESCKYVCYSEKELEAHNASIGHSTDRRSFCDICKQSFTNIYQHKAAVHSDARPFLCNQCGYSAKTKSSLRYHMVIHLDTKDWSCPKCSYKSSSERRLKRHMKIHDPNKKHQCSKCSFATHDAYEFKRHFTKVHSRVKSFNCKFCGQTFLKHHEIRLHLMFEHECNDAFFCNFCAFTCATRADYKEHIQVHYGKNKHVCEICGFTGRYRTHYRRHMLTHTSNKPFTCKICFKSVREASNLRRHMLTHSEDKPLACSVCGYRCKIRSRLMNHMKTHSELRPFACHLCKYTTKFNGNLMKHLENHARYKPHKCQFCSYACNERNKLRRHMNFRHKGLIDPKKEPEEEAGHEDKDLVILPSQEQFLLVPKEELEKIVSVDEKGAILPTNSNTIVVTADSGEIANNNNTSERQIVISDQGDADSGSIVTSLKDLKEGTLIAALDI